MPPNDTPSESELGNPIFLFKADSLSLAIVSAGTPLREAIWASIWEKPNLFCFFGSSVSPLLSLAIVSAGTPLLAAKRISLRVNLRAFSLFGSSIGPYNCSSKVSAEMRFLWASNKNFLEYFFGAAKFGMNPPANWSSRMLDPGMSLNLKL